MWSTRWIPSGPTDVTSPLSGVRVGGSGRPQAARYPTRNETAKNRTSFTTCTLPTPQPPTVLALPRRFVNATLRRLGGVTLALIPRPAPYRRNRAIGRGENRVIIGASPLDLGYGSSVRLLVGRC